jgi:hypothetical protein
MVQQAFIDDFKETVVNYMHEVDLVIPDEPKEQKIRWCNEHSLKHVSEQHLDALRDVLRMPDASAEELVSTYTTDLWKTVFAPPAVPPEPVETTLEQDASVARTHSQLVDVAAQLSLIVEASSQSEVQFETSPETVPDIVPPEVVPPEVVPETVPEPVHETHDEIVEEVLPPTPVHEDATHQEENVHEEEDEAEEVVVAEQPKKRGRKPKKDLKPK